MKLNIYEYILLNFYEQFEHAINQDKGYEIFKPENFNSEKDYTDALTSLTSKELLDGGFGFPTQITSKGIKSLQSYKIQIEQKERLKTLSNKKLEFDAKNSKRIYQTYWITFALSIAAFIISLILLILKLKE